MFTFTRLGLVATTVLLTSCAIDPTQIPPEELMSDQCLELRYQIISNDNDRAVPEGQGHNPAVDASLYKEYERLNCEDVIAENRGKSIKN